MSRLRTPLKRARGLGSAKDGVHHFAVQRLSAIALIGLTAWFVWFVLRLLGSDYLAAADAVASPVNAVLLVTFLAIGFWHAQLGLQVIIEDYVHTPGLAVAVQVAVRFVCFLGALAGIFAVLRIALGGV